MNQPELIMRKLNQRNFKGFHIQTYLSIGQVINHPFPYPQGLSIEGIEIKLEDLKHRNKRLTVK